jgi:uncharacterized coiled-coil DUF342 family protein
MTEKQTSEGTNIPQPTSQPEKKEIKTGNSKEQIQDLKKKLDELNAEKEKWFSQRESYSKQIKTDIGKIKSSATTRNTLTTSVKEQKTKRRELNQKITEKIKQVKELQEKQKGNTEKRERGMSPEILKKRMAGLEKRIETEGLTFEKEIKGLKKQYDAAKKEQGNWGTIKQLSKEISELKKEADSAHKKVQQKASTSQEEHETLIKTSRNIDDLKKKEREAHTKFIELKKEFTLYNDQLKALLPEVKRDQHKKEQKNKQKKAKKKAENKKTLQEKAEIVEEKIKSGKRVKLTMDDLLAFQAKK